jgi:RNA polymerase sigma factor (sigma-70 family)
VAASAKIQAMMDESMRDNAKRTQDDQELLGRVAAADPAAFQELYQRHVDQLIGFAVRRLSSPEEVADLVSAVFLEAIQSAKRYDPAKAEAISWLFGIAANLLAQGRRRGTREAFALQRLAGQRLLQPDEYEELERRIDAAHLHGAVHAAVAALPDGERQLVELVSFDGLSPTQAAGVIGVHPAAARMRLSRARHKLRRALSRVTPTTQPAARSVSPRLQALEKE